jgi:hypothetical protein
MNISHCPSWAMELWAYKVHSYFFSDMSKEDFASFWHSVCDDSEDLENTLSASCQLIAEYLELDQIEWYTDNAYSWYHNKVGKKIRFFSDEV